MKKISIKQLNKIAAKDSLELIKGHGYFYWIATTDEMHADLCMLQETSVYTCHFNQLSKDQWLEELDMIKEKIKNRDPYSELC